MGNKEVIVWGLEKQFRFLLKMYGLEDKARRIGVGIGAAAFDGASLTGHIHFDALGF